jgi:hypothetical protein
MLSFLQPMLEGGLKSNRHLAFAVVTGVLRVSREGLWSTFNNTRIFSVLDEQLSTICGFTEEDVAELLVRTGSPLQLSELRRWYNGYLFGGRVVYNPWSVLHAISAGQLRPWWAETASHHGLGLLLRQGGSAMLSPLEGWLLGEQRRLTIRDDLLIQEQRVEDVPALLLHGGYLSPVGVQGRSGRWEVELRVPNLDVLSALQAATERWLLSAGWGHDRPDQVEQALLSGDAALGDLLTELLVAVSSSHDFPWTDRERGYHCFLLGVLVRLRPRYQVISNLESGLGRADLLLVPSDGREPGVVVELKRGESEGEARRLVGEALEQARSLRYEARLREAGVGRVLCWGVAFWGRSCLARAEVAG